ncbi:hypothetical protein [Nannocystis sp.]|uniref:hypothetical protein n=1 Tax=Nannocystis sp. TaxID=1962667 RepID=UPI0025FACEFB|nr:hypothetical protein [Nannocystis sp.]
MKRRPSHSQDGRRPRFALTAWAGTSRHPAPTPPGTLDTETDTDTNTDTGTTA